MSTAVLLLGKVFRMGFHMLFQKTSWLKLFPTSHARIDSQGMSTRALITAVWYCLESCLLLSPVTHLYARGCLQCHSGFQFHLSYYHKLLPTLLVWRFYFMSSICCSCVVVVLLQLHPNLPQPRWHKLQQFQQHWSQMFIFLLRVIDSHINYLFPWPTFNSMIILRLFLHNVYSAT